MADTKITALTALTGADPANDVIPIVDVSDTTMAASGTTKKISVNNILGASGTATLASATITGDLTVDTSTLKVDSANNRVGILTASPTHTLDVRGIIKSNGTYTAYVNPSFTGAAAIQTESAESLILAPSGQESLRCAPSGVYTFGDGAGGTRMTLNSTGLGVGRSPSYKLDVAGVANFDQLRVTAANATKMDLVNTTSGLTYSLFSANTAANGFDGFGIFNGTSYDLQIVSGNVGIGVTPSAWGGAYVRALQMLNGSSLVNNQTNNSHFGLNCYHNGTNWVYVSTNTASRYEQFNGGHYWHSAPSGTAGNNITGANAFVTVMQIDTAGNFIILPTNTPPTLSTNGQISINATSNTNLRFRYRGSDGITRTADITLA